jgi:hypothetical protein
MQHCFNQFICVKSSTIVYLFMLSMFISITRGKIHSINAIFSKYQGITIFALQIFQSGIPANLPACSKISLYSSSQKGYIPIQDVTMSLVPLDSGTRHPKKKVVHLWCPYTIKFKKKQRTVLCFFFVINLSLKQKP